MCVGVYKCGVRVWPSVGDGRWDSIVNSASGCVHHMMYDMMYHMIHHMMHHKESHDESHDAYVHAVI